MAWPSHWTLQEAKIFFNKTYGFPSLDPEDDHPASDTSSDSELSEDTEGPLALEDPATIDSAEGASEPKPQLKIEDSAEVPMDVGTNGNNNMYGNIFEHLADVVDEKKLKFTAALQPNAWERIQVKKEPQPDVLERIQVKKEPQPDVLERSQVKEESATGKKALPMEPFVIEVAPVHVKVEALEDIELPPGVVSLRRSSRACVKAKGPGFYKSEPQNRKTPANTPATPPSTRRRPTRRLAKSPTLMPGIKKEVKLEPGSGFSSQFGFGL